MRLHRKPHVLLTVALALLVLLASGGAAQAVGTITISGMSKTSFGISDCNANAKVSFQWEPQNVAINTMVQTSLNYEIILGNSADSSSPDVVLLQSGTITTVAKKDFPDTSKTLKEDTAKKMVKDGALTIKDLIGFHYATSTDITADNMCKKGSEEDGGDVTVTIYVVLKNVKELGTDTGSDISQ